MSILKIARMGDPALSCRSELVADPTSSEIRRLLFDMHETMVDADGTGLAAPQVHDPRRVMLFMAERGESEIAAQSSEFAPLTALINPTWQSLSDDTELGWEGCLSVPGLTGAVPRHTHIQYQGFTPDGELIKREATGFHARVFQHEYDHLDGILYPQRMTDLSLLVFTEEVRRHGLPLLGSECRVGAIED